MGTLRTAEADAFYRQQIAAGILEGPCKLCTKEAVHTFNHWRIIENDFPYDLIATVHHMLIPKRHVTERDLNQEEREELLDIKDTFLATEYEYISEATHKKKTIPGHFHLHVLVTKG
jgi:diadenosine tetraphosphate (Ap4A) HIT family hydrolase